MRLVYLGSPEAAVVPLDAIVEAGHDVVLVVSQPDRRRGRGATLSPSPVKAAALRLGLPVSDQVDDVVEAVARGAELGIVVAYGRIIRANLLDAVPFVNLHFSLLPRWRGAAPVERAILAGDTETGVCLMAVEAGLDTGGVYRRISTPIGRRDTAAELRTRLAHAGAELLVAALAGGTVAALGTAEPQVGDVTWADKLGPADFHLDWALPAVQLDRVVRIGGAWTTFRGKRLRVVAAEADATTRGDAGTAPGKIHGDVVTCGSGSLRLLVLQPEGKAAMTVAAWAHGARPLANERLGS